MFTRFMRLKELFSGRSTETDYAEAIAENIKKIDEHDHTGGKGSPIPITAIDANASLNMQNNTIVDVGAVNLTDDERDLTTVPEGSIFEIAGDLYWKNEDGDIIRVTSGATLAGLTPGGASFTDVFDRVAFNNATRQLTLTRKDGGEVTVDIPTDPAAATQFRRSVVNVALVQDNNGVLVYRLTFGSGDTEDVAVPMTAESDDDFVGVAIKDGDGGSKFLRFYLREGGDGNDSDPAFYKDVALPSFPQDYFKAVELSGNSLVFTKADDTKTSPLVLPAPSGQEFVDVDGGVNVSSGGTVTGRRFTFTRGGGGTKSILVPVAAGGGGGGGDVMTSDIASLLAGGELEKRRVRGAAGSNIDRYRLSFNRKDSSNAALKIDLPSDDINQAFFSVFRGIPANGRGANGGRLRLTIRRRDGGLTIYNMRDTLNEIIDMDNIIKGVTTQTSGSTHRLIFTKNDGTTFPLTLPSFRESNDDFIGVRFDQNNGAFTFTRRGNPSDARTQEVGINIQTYVNNRLRNLLGITTGQQSNIKDKSAGIALAFVSATLGDSTDRLDKNRIYFKYAGAPNSAKITDQNASSNFAILDLNSILTAAQGTTWTRNTIRAAVITGDFGSSANAQIHYDSDINATLRKELRDNVYSFRRTAGTVANIAVRRLRLAPGDNYFTNSKRVELACNPGQAQNTTIWFPNSSELPATGKSLPLAITRASDSNGVMQAGIVPRQIDGDDIEDNSIPLSKIQGADSLGGSQQRTYRVVALPLNTRWNDGAVATRSPGVFSSRSQTSGPFDRNASGILINGGEVEVDGSSLTRTDFANSPVNIQVAYSYYIPTPSVLNFGFAGGKNGDLWGLYKIVRYRDHRSSNKTLNLLMRSWTSKQVLAQHNDEEIRALECHLDLNYTDFLWNTAQGGTESIFSQDIQDAVSNNRLTSVKYQLRLLQTGDDPTENIIYFSRYQDRAYSNNSIPSNVGSNPIPGPSTNSTLQAFFRTKG